MTLPHGCHLREGRCPVCGEPLRRVDDVEGLPVYVCPVEDRRRTVVADVADRLTCLARRLRGCGMPAKADACELNARVLRDALNGGGA